jgi:hypothetical protein
MSFVTTPIRQVLYDNVHQPNAHEHHTKAFWHHILTKDLFPEEHFAVLTESTPSSHLDDALRRVDLLVSTFNPQQKLRIIFINEMKRKGGSADSVEAQVQEACEACVKETKEDVWAMTVIGTTAKMWQYTSGKTFYALTSVYIDAKSPSAQLIRDIVVNMKASIANGSSASIASGPPAQYDSLFLIAKFELTFIIGQHKLLTAGTQLVTVDRGTSEMAHGQTIFYHSLPASNDKTCFSL